MSKVLIKTDYNWADEADFPSFCIMTQEELTRAKEFVKEFFVNEQNDICVAVGTNEEINFSTYDCVFSGTVIKPLTDRETATITKFFGKQFGECSLLRVLENMQYTIAYNERCAKEDNNLEDE